MKSKGAAFCSVVPHLHSNKYLRRVRRAESKL